MLNLSVMVKLMEVTKLTQRMNAKHFMFEQLMELDVGPSTASSDQMVHCSTSTISSVTGDSILNMRLLLLMLWGLSTIHILLIRSDKQNNHLKKKKCEKYENKIMETLTD